MLRIYFFFIITILLTAFCSINAKAQYFYKDIWNARQLNKEMSILKAQKVKLISVKSFEDDGTPSEGFFCEKRINKNYTVSETVTRSNVTSESLLASDFNSKGLIIKTTDSTESSLNITEYFYNDSDQVVTVKTYAKAYDDPYAINETRNYIYNAAGKPEKMIRKKDETEISATSFKIDERGNVIEEDETAKNEDIKKYFYYYDDKNNLTDVVHYNERAKRLLPDYMYEYDAAGHIKQMITTEEGGGYVIWRYTYNDQQLRESERCFSKEKKLLGSIQYSYK